MEQSDLPSYQQREKLPDLPSSNDEEFWGDAEKFQGIPEAVNAEGPHYFILIRGKEVYCQHCGWGFMLDKGDTVKDGHVFSIEKHLVI